MIELGFRIIVGGPGIKMAAETMYGFNGGLWWAGNVPTMQVVNADMNIVSCCECLRGSGGVMNSCREYVGDVGWEGSCDGEDSGNRLSEGNSLRQCNYISDSCNDMTAIIFSNDAGRGVVIHDFQIPGCPLGSSFPIRKEDCLCKFFF